MKVQKTFLLLLCILLGFTSLVFAGEIALPENQKAYILENSSSDTIKSQSESELIAPQEMSQLMAALVALDTIGNNLSGSVVVSDVINSVESASSKTGLEIDQEVTYQDLLHAILMTSSYDATAVLASQIGGGDSKSEDPNAAIQVFVTKMNEKAKEIGMTNTTFTNPYGIDEDGNVTTIQDLTILMKNVLGNQTAKRILTTAAYSIKLDSFIKEESSDNKTGQENNTPVADKIETPTLDIQNTFLTVMNQSQAGQENTEETVAEENTQQEQGTQEESTAEQPAANATDVSAVFIAGLDTDNAIIGFNTAANDADIIGCISGDGAYVIKDEIVGLTQELKDNYIFKDLSAEDGNFGQYKLANTSLFSSKNLNLTADSSIRSFVSKDEAENIKTNIVWNDEILSQNGEDIMLVQSIEPGTQVAQLEITKGDVKRLVPLFSVGKANVKSLKDTLLVILFWIILIVCVAFLILRIIYVQNRRKMLKRRRARRRKRQLALEKQKKEQKQKPGEDNKETATPYTSPLRRAARSD